MTRKSNILPILFCLFLLASCTTYRKAVTTAPVNMQLNVTTSDLEYVGEVTGTATQSFVIGIPYGGRRYYSTSVGIAGGGLLPINNRGIDNALYDALMQKPDADFLIPFGVEEVRNQQFLGSKRTYTIHAKAFRLKTK